MVYICSSLLHLAPGSHDLSQAEKRYFLVTERKAEKIHKRQLFSLKMTTLFIQDNFECHFVNLLSFT